jgi:hypothetical protein
MKRILLAVLVLASALPVSAENRLRNPDFADGISHWYGDVKAPDSAQADPFATNAASPSPGLIINLKDRSWTKATQQFSVKKEASLVMKIVYKMSSDIAFSNDPDEYKNVPNHIDFNRWLPFDIHKGDWMIMLSDLDNNDGRYFVVTPNSSATEQTFSGPFKFTAGNNKTICLAFPPGSGTVTILHTSVDDPE